MPPYRAPASLEMPDAGGPTHAAPPLVAFGIDANRWRMLTLEGRTATALAIDRHGGAIRLRSPIDLEGEGVQAVFGREGFAIFARSVQGLTSWSALHDDAHVAHATWRADVPRFDFAAIASDGRPAVLVSGVSAVGGGVDAATLRSYAEARDPRFEVTHARWDAPLGSRALIGAGANVFGPIALFATDRDDEIDLAPFRPDAAVSARTISLGRGQRFAAAAFGGRRVFVVSRDAEGLTARTVASDLRTELNPVPIRAKAGTTIGRVVCAYANGPFVLAHEEENEGLREVVLSVFDAGLHTAMRLSLPRVDGVLVEGKDVAVAALVPGASAPMLLVERTTTAAARRRHYAYFIAPVRSDTPEARRALLADVASMIAVCLGTASPIALHMEPYDDGHDLVRFRVPGRDGAHDLSFAILSDERGGGVASIRVGGGAAPNPDGLGFAARMREIFTGDDDGDPMTTRIRLDVLANGVEAIVGAVAGMRASAGGA